MATLEIRPAGEGDLAAIRAIFAGALPEVWSLAALREELSYPYACFLCAVQAGEVAGFADARFVFGDGELLNIAVSPAFRRRGVGKALLDAVFAAAKEAQVQVLTLEVRARNQDARRFYEALGFVPVGVRRGFYQNPPDDACLYQWKPED